MFTVNIYPSDIRISFDMLPIVFFFFSEIFLIDDFDMFWKLLGNVLILSYFVFTGKIDEQCLYC